VVLTVENMLISFVLAFSATYLLSPFVKHLERMGLSRNLAVLIPFLTLLILMTALIVVTIPLIVQQSQEFRNELPKYIEGISFLITKWEKQFKEFFPYVFKFNFVDNAAHFVENFVTNTIQAAPKLAQQFLTVCLLAPLFCYFLLKDGHNISRGILSLFPNSFFEMALSLSHKINAQLGDFVRARLMEAIIVGIVVWIGLTILGFPYAIFLALFAVVMNLIPYVGPFIGAIPAFIIAIINQEPSLNVLLMSMVYFIAQLIDIVFVIPLVVARTVNLHPVTVIVVFIIGAHLLGVLGMIIAVPMASVIKLVFFTIYDQLIKFRA
jgi:putative permease